MHTHTHNDWHQHTHLAHSTPASAHALFYAQPLPCTWPQLVKHHSVRVCAWLRLCTSARFRSPPGTAAVSNAAFMRTCMPATPRATAAQRVPQRVLQRMPQRSHLVDASRGSAEALWEWGPCRDLVAVAGSPCALAQALMHGLAPARTCTGTSLSTRLCSRESGPMAHA